MDRVQAASDTSNAVASDAQANSGGGSMGVMSIGFSDNVFINFFLNMLLAMLVVVLLLLLSKLVANFIKRRIVANSMSEDEYSVKVATLMGDFVFFSLMIFSILLGLSIIGLEVGWLLGGISFGLGFAFKDFIGNMIAGVFVLTNKEYKLGDLIEVVYDLRRGITYFGRIEEITIRYTILRTLDMRKVIIPNIDMVTKPVRTFTSEDMVRLDSIVQVHYDTDIDAVIDIIIQAINSLDFVIEKDKTRVLVEGFENGAVNLKAQYFFDPNGDKVYLEVTSVTNKTIYQSLRKQGIVIPYPHTSITMDKADKNLLGGAVYLMQQAKKSKQEE